uniref:Uncharacterized protein n=1 Tax=Ditylenchus dipsaci TaxID=166011 RepID=A0A915E574_9BILA
MTAIYPPDLQSPEPSVAPCKAPQILLVYYVHTHLSRQLRSYRDALKEVCLEARKHCALLMQQYGFKWPLTPQCDPLPKMADQQSSRQLRAAPPDAPDNSNPTVTRAMRHRCGGQTMPVQFVLQFAVQLLRNSGFAPKKKIVPFQKFPEPSSRHMSGMTVITNAANNCIYMSGKVYDNGAERPATSHEKELIAKNEKDWARWSREFNAGMQQNLAQSCCLGYAFGLPIFKQPPKPPVLPCFCKRCHGQGNGINF